MANFNQDHQAVLVELLLGIPFVLQRSNLCWSNR